MASLIQLTCVWEALGAGDGQGGLVCYSPWGHKKLDTNEQLNWNRLICWGCHISKYHRLGGLSCRNCFSVLEARSPTSKHWQSCFHLRLWGRLCYRSSSLDHLPSVHVTVSKFPPFIRTPVTLQVRAVMTVMTLFPLDYLCKDTTSKYGYPLSYRDFNT